MLGTIRKLATDHCLDLRSKISHLYKTFQIRSLLQVIGGIEGIDNPMDSVKVMVRPVAHGTLS